MIKGERVALLWGIIGILMIYLFYKVLMELL